MLDRILGRVRGLNPGNFPENREDEQFQMNNWGDQLCSQGLPGRAELVRLGDSWQVISASVAALTAVPTTVAVNRLWNGEPGNGKSYVIERVFAVKIIVDTTQYDTFGIWAINVKQPVVTAIPTDDATVIRSLSGKSYGGRARKDASTANSGVANQWQCIGTSPNQDTVIGGSAWSSIDIPLFGQYIIPPGGAFGVHISEVTATASKWRIGYTWHEILIPYAT